MKKIFLTALLFMGFIPTFLKPAPERSLILDCVGAAAIGYTSASLWSHFIKKMTLKNEPVPDIKKVTILTIDNATNFDTLSRTLLRLAKNKQCSGVILKINNTGGIIGKFSVAHDLIKKIASRKPIISLIMDRAISCGYWLASATHFIIAHSGSELGAIGSIIEIERHTNKSTEKNLKYNLKIEVFRGGKYKALWHPDLDASLNEEIKKYYQEKANNAYKEMLASITNNRKFLDINKADVWAEGKDFTAKQGLELELIDAIGTQFEAEEKMAEMLDVSLDLISFYEIKL